MSYQENVLVSISGGGTIATRVNDADVDINACHLTGDVYFADNSLLGQSVVNGNVEAASPSVLIEGNRITTTTDDGVTLSSSLATVIGNIITAGNHAVNINGGDNNLVVGNFLYQPGTETDDTYDGVHLQGDANGNTITGNRLFPSEAANDTRYGINISAATVDDTHLGINHYGDTSQYGTDYLNDAGTSTIYANAYEIDLSDGRGTLTTGTGNMEKLVTQNSRIVGVRSRMGTAPTGSSSIHDLNIDGTTAFTTQGNRPTVSAGSNNSSTTLPDVVDVSAGSYLSGDIDQIGSTVAGGHLVLSVTLITV